MLDLNDQQEQNESGIAPDCYHVCHPLERVNLQEQKADDKEESFDIIGF